MKFGIIRRHSEPEIRHGLGARVAAGSMSGIVLTNTQRALRVKRRLVLDRLQAMLQVVGYRDWAMGVAFTTDKVVQQLNRFNRQVDQPTDILSFPFQPSIATPGQLGEPKDRVLGDLFLSTPYMLRRTPDVEALNRELPVLFAHGICHLLGYVHERDEDFERMQAEEERILREYQRHLQYPATLRMVLLPGGGEDDRRRRQE